MSAGTLQAAVAIEQRQRLLGRARRVDDLHRRVDRRGWRAARHRARRVRRAGCGMRIVMVSFGSGGSSITVARSLR
jgi:hypothetical protein